VEVGGGGGGREDGWMDAGGLMETRRKWMMRKAEDVVCGEVWM
jgi:hypothetical protein